MRALLFGTAAFAVALLGACSSRSSEGSPVASISDAATDAGPEPDVATAADAGLPAVPLEVVSYSTGGKYLRAEVSVNGSSPVGVLVDTGSVGLRIFKAALGGAAVTMTSVADEADFGGNVMSGHQATAAVTIGSGSNSATSDAATPIVVVEKFSCSQPGCDVADGTGGSYESQGIHGILGISLRRDARGVQSPLAALPGNLGKGFSITGVKFDPAQSKDGRLVLGLTPTGAVAEGIQLKRTGTLPTGAPGWADDQVQLCFTVDDAPTDPSCVEGAFDTGSNYDVIYAKNLAAKVQNGILVSGTKFEVKAGTATQWSFTVGNPVQASLDGVIVDTSEPFALMGVATFFRYQEIRFDIARGVISFEH